MCERWVGDRTDCNILTPSSSDYSNTSAGLLNRGSLRALCLELVLTASNCNSNSNCNWHQLTQAVCGTWLYNCLISTCFLWTSAIAPNSTRPQVKGIPLYLRPDALVSWLTAGSRVNMLLIYTYICVYTSMHLYIYTHISANCCWEGVTRSKGVWEGKSGRGGGGKWIVTIRLISFSLNPS